MSLVLSGLTRETNRKYLKKASKAETADSAKEMMEIIFKGLERFIDYQILQYDNFSNVDIHYVGSIAYYLRDEITKVGNKYNLKTGKFIQRPITGLVDYHKRNILN